MVTPDVHNFKPSNLTYENSAIDLTA